jgi:hypothetical protein
VMGWCLFGDIPQSTLLCPVEFMYRVHTDVVVCPKSATAGTIRPHWGSCYY